MSSQRDAGGSEPVIASATASSASASPPSPRRAMGRAEERWMSFSWFIGLHVPILVGLCTGNTSLAHSLWSREYFDDDAADAVATTHAGGTPGVDPAPPRSYPPAYGVWYPAAFFTLLLLTAIAYFGTALSYPGYVGLEYRRSKEREKASAEC